MRVWRVRVVHARLFIQVSVCMLRRAVCACTIDKRTLVAIGTARLTKSENLRVVATPVLFHGIWRPPSARGATFEKNNDWANERRGSVPREALPLTSKLVKS